MTDIPHRTKTFSQSSHIDLSPLVRASRAAFGLVFRALAATAHAGARLPGLVASAFAMAYVEPFAPRRRDDWSNPDRF